jgi:hypothetical protein
MKKLILIGAALLLSACGSSRDDDHDMGTPPPTPGPVADAFYTRLNGVVGAMPEDAEPVDISMITPTEPENTEPVGG